MMGKCFSAVTTSGLRIGNAITSPTNREPTRLNMTVDNVSPPGAWRTELDRRGVKSDQDLRIDDALATLRIRGLWTEAAILSTEINAMKAEIYRLKRSPTG